MLSGLVAAFSHAMDGVGLLFCYTDSDLGSWHVVGV